MGSMNGREYATQKRAWLRRHGVTSLYHVVMDHLHPLELDSDELITIAFIDRLQDEPPKFHIESYTALAYAMRIERSTLYRRLKALESPLAMGDEALRPAYITQQDCPVGIRYSFDALYDRLEVILTECACQRCTKFRALHPLASAAPPAPRTEPQPGTMEGVFDFYHRKAADERLLNNAQEWR